MSKIKIALPVLLLALIAGGFYIFGSRHETIAPEAAKEEIKALPDTTQISKEAADAMGIKTDIVGNAVVHETITLAGRITLNQNTTAQVKARFSGIVREVKKGYGETVKVGDVLAMVESNDSLRTYPVQSPINGVILARNTNTGDVAGDQPLFTIANVSDVWAEFHVFPRDIDHIQSGQKVRIISFEGNHTSEAMITLVSPVAEASSQTIVARVTLPNTEGLWHSGMTVRGDVMVNEKQVLLGVKKSAIQRMEGKTVIFIQDGDRYSMRPIKIGVSDSDWVEVLDGLKEGEVYVSENSFLIKADIGKAGAKDED